MLGIHVQPLSLVCLIAGCCAAAAQEPFSATHKPVLYGRHWVAITGKPLGAAAGAKMFERGGNAIDAACAMLGVVCTMFDDVSWGGETQALIYDPRNGKVVGVNGCGVAPTGATPGFFQERGLAYPPEEGPLAAITPGTPGALMVMLAEFGTLSLKDVLEPAMELAGGFPVDADLARKMRHERATLLGWPYSRKVFFGGTGQPGAMPRPGELWRQPDLLATLQKLVETETQALKEGRGRREAIEAAYERFYRGDIAAEFCRGSREQGGLHTLADLSNWRVKIEDTLHTTYKGIEVHKLKSWTQGPALLQTLDLVERLDLKSMGYNSARYIHALYQAMNLAFADRDFYYGDPDSPPEEPIELLLSKAYARDRLQLIDWTANNPDIRPGDPYEFAGRTNPFLHHLRNWSNLSRATNDPSHAGARGRQPPGSAMDREAAFRAGTTSLQAADSKGWAISITPSGGWMPACIAGNTGIGMSQRMQSFVLDEAENPFNVVAPGKRPRVTLTPTLALKNGKPFLCFSVQGGDTQEQNLLQFFLNMVEFGMSVQEASEAANFTSYQMRASFGEHAVEPGRLTLTDEVPSWVRKELIRMGYRLDFVRKNSGPITAIYFDQAHGTLQGAASNHGEDYGIAW